MLVHQTPKLTPPVWIRPTWRNATKHENKFKHNQKRLKRIHPQQLDRPVSQLEVALGVSILPTNSMPSSSQSRIERSHVHKARKETGDHLTSQKFWKHDQPQAPLTRHHKTKYWRRHVALCCFMFKPTAFYIFYFLVTQDDTQEHIGWLIWLGNDLVSLSAFRIFQIVTSCLWRSCADGWSWPRVSWCEPRIPSYLRSQSCSNIWTCKKTWPM